MGLFFSNHCQFCFQIDRTVVLKDMEPSFPFVSFRVGTLDATLSLLLHTSIFEALLYRELGKRLPCTKRVSAHGNATASRNSQWLDRPSSPPGKVLFCWACRNPNFLKYSWFPACKSSPVTTQTGCTRGSTAGWGPPCRGAHKHPWHLPYFEAVSLHLVFLQN